MQPEIAICNIFGQDADRLAEFAFSNGFSGIDWSIDPDQSEREFVSLMGRLAGLQVRYHCRFFGVDLAYTDRRGDESLALLTATVEKVALAGGQQMTVHIGLDNPSGAGIELWARHRQPHPPRRTGEPLRCSRGPGKPDDPHYQ